MLKTLAAILAVVTALTVSSAAVVRAESYSEYEVKAAFLLNFAKLVQWPASAFQAADDPLFLGILGEDPFGDTLKSLVENRRVGDRRIEVQHVGDVTQVKAYHMVFVSMPPPVPVRDILTAVQGASVLLVGDGHDFARQGGIISFFKEEGKVRFAINRHAADRAGLKISSRILSLARLVGEDSSARPPRDEWSSKWAGAWQSSAVLRRALGRSFVLGGSKNMQYGHLPSGKPTF